MKNVISFSTRNKAFKHEADLSSSLYASAPLHVMLNSYAP
jgi:hypothetical protein